MLSALAATLTSTNLFQRVKSVMVDIVEGNMSGVHLQECVSGFGPQRCVECGGLSGKREEIERRTFWHSETRESCESLLEEKQKRREEKM